MQAQDGVTFSNVGATTGPFVLAGGLYGVHVVATFGGGSVTLQKLAAGGTFQVFQRFGQQFEEGILGLGRAMCGVTGARHR